MIKNKRGLGKYISFTFAVLVIILIFAGAFGYKAIVADREEARQRDISLKTFNDGSAGKLFFLKEGEKSILGLFKEGYSAEDFTLGEQEFEKYLQYIYGNSLPLSVEKPDFEVENWQAYVMPLGGNVVADFETYYNAYSNLRFILVRYPLLFNLYIVEVKKAEAVETVSGKLGISGEGDELNAYFEEAGLTFGFDPAFLKAIAKVESGFKSDVISVSGAVGVMQVRRVASDPKYITLISGEEFKEGMKSSDVPGCCEMESDEKNSCENERK